MDMCPKDLVCDINTWYVPERPGICSRKYWLVLENAVMCTQLMTDNLL